MFLITFPKNIFNNCQKEKYLITKTVDSKLHNLELVVNFLA